MSSPLTVLLAEDDPVFRRVMLFTLQRCNFPLQIETVADGVSAYQYVCEKQVDFLVTDQQMPGMTGLELLERLDQNPDIREIPTILCTAKGFELDSESLRQQYRLVDVIHKPFSPRRLSKLIVGHFSESVAIHG